MFIVFIVLDDCGSTHPKLHTIDSGHSPWFYNKTLNATGSCSGITCVGLSEYYRLTVSGCTSGTMECFKLCDHFSYNVNAIVEKKDKTKNTWIMNMIPDSYHLSYKVSDLVKMIQPLTNIEVLDLSGSIGSGSGYPIEQFKKLLLPLIHLKTLDISGTLFLNV